MKIATMGDSHHTISGFGTALRYLDTYLHNVGHNVYHIGWQTFGQEMIATFHDKILGYTALPNIGGKQFGQDAWKFWLPQLEPDVFLTLADFWMLIDLFRSDLNYPWCMWYPIDGYPLTTQLIEMLKKLDYRVCISEYGRDMVRGAGIETAHVPHGVDTSTYKPRGPQEKIMMKERLGIPPKTIVIGRVDRNQTRKMFPRAIQIFVQIHKMFPETVLLLWTDRRDQEGWDLEFICERYGLVIGRDVFFPPIEMMPNFMYGVSNEELSKIMNVIDIHLWTTGGEGFGLTGLETMACGCLNVATDYTTPPEIFQFRTKKPCGLPIRVGEFDMGNAGVDRAFVDINHGIEQVKWALENPDEVIQMKKNGVERAQKYYDWGIIVKQFDEFLRDSIK